ncbi:hypothetical protein HRbin15_00345 [bacterium HR15]|nr:hypothetical protein HRbin15_00345 [bacterium HR15]
MFEIPRYVRHNESPGGRACKRAEIVRRRQRGQTLVIALLVAFVLLILGGVFIVTIARSLLHVQQAREGLSADYFAEAGLHYAIEQLVNSEEGADWRPIPDNLTNPRDPDYFWLKPYNPADGTGGFTRVNFSKGRALIRVSYQASGPIHRHPVIKIESVGRPGLVDPNDPTTLSGADISRRREKVAYLQIGVIDYLRFVMNRDQRATLMDFGAEEVGLGVPYRLILGNPERDTNNPDPTRREIGFAPIHVNGNLRWSGNVQIALNPDRGERVYVAGEIIHHENTTVTLITPRGQISLLPSRDPNFITAGGLYRDGKPTTAIDGYPRSIAYLEPPRMDTVDPATGRPRYISLTRESGIWRQRPNGSWYNTGQYGYGRGIYIDNTQDIQQESRSFIGGYSLRSDWLKPGNSRYWNGPFYEPPGAYIELVEQRNGNQITAQGFRITRNQSVPNDVWFNPLTGTPTNIKTLSFFFRDPANPANNMLTNEFTRNNRQFDVPFNGVIYAEGNVRVRGIIPSGRQITIVTNGTAYIEGNLVKGDERSALAIIAKDYVCVNTTQFLRRTWQSPSVAQGDPTNVEAPFYFEVLPNRPMQLQFSFGVDPQDYTGNFGGLKLYLRHAAGGAGSFINLLVNPSVSPNPLYQFNQPGFPTYMYPLGRTTFQVYPNYEKVAFTLAPQPAGSNYLLDATAGVENLLQLQLQPLVNPLDGFRLPTDNAPYYLSAAAIQPLDIRIEAALFAQNGSFFVIPGYWFNTNPRDTRENAQRNNGRRTPGVASPEFPFYGEPLDIKITIVGAIAENFTAALGDQTEWLRKWGWIPIEYGNSGFTIPDQHQEFFHDTLSGRGRYAVNLLMRYDPIFRNPFVSGVPIRVAYDATQDPSGQHPGRILPPIPKLPVCPKPIYEGDAKP